jgi:hypothetical protein
MKYKTVIYTTVRAEIHHDIEFAGKGDALAQIMQQELLDYANILGGASCDEDMRVTEVEVVTDEVQDYNLAPDEDYADDDEEDEDD